MADYSVSLSADPDMLRARLIDRKIATGCALEDAEKFVDFSDMTNVKLCLNKTKAANLALKLTDHLQIVSQRA